MRRQRAEAGHRPSCLGRILALIVPLGVVVAGALYLSPSLRDRVDEWRDPDDPHVVEPGDQDAEAVIGAAVDHPDIDSIRCIETGLNGMTAVVDLTNRGWQVVPRPPAEALMVGLLLLFASPFVLVGGVVAAILVVAGWVERRVARPL